MSQEYSGSAEAKTFPLPTALATPPWDGILGFFERGCAFCVLAMAAPLLLLIALAIKLDSRGPVIFRQRRVGINPWSGAGAPAASLGTFTMFKFRSFFEDADRMMPERARFDFEAERIDSVCLQLEDDPRATRVGKHIRRLSLDELPNLWNVARGEMRFVGPRPEVPEMLRYYSPEQLAKFSVKPGLTGLAQVSGRGNLNFGDTLACDMRYVRDRCLRLDVAILWKTVRLMFTREGSF